MEESVDPVPGTCDDRMEESVPETRDDRMEESVPETRDDGIDLDPVPETSDDGMDLDAVPDTSDDGVDLDLFPGTSDDGIDLDPFPGTSHASTEIDPGPVVLFSDDEETLLDRSTRPSGARVLDDTPTYPQRTLLHYPDFPTPEEHDTLNLLQGDVPPIQFHNANLQLAASYVVRFFHTQETHEWFHVMVKAVVFDLFVKALEEDVETRTLAFSCWCNGGAYGEDEHRHHRHLIAVSPKGRFKPRVWSKVALPKGIPKPKKNCSCKKLKRIHMAMHLVNTIGYMSHTKSRCQFSFKDKKNTPEGEHHFYLYRTLPKRFRLPLVLLWDGGVYELLYQEKFQNVSLPKVVQGGLEWVNRQWRQRIRQFYHYETGWVVSLSRRFVPASHATSHYLCLMHGKRLYFQELPEPLEEDAWLQKQVAGGHGFYEAVGEEWWAPRPRDKKVLNFHMPVVKANQAFQARVNAERQARMKRAHADKKQTDDELKRLRAENKQLRDTMNHSDQEKKHLHEEIRRLWEDKERLHEEINRLHERLTDSWAAQWKAKEEDLAQLKRNQAEMIQFIKQVTVQLKAKDAEIKTLTCQLRAKDEERAQFKN